MHIPVPQPPITGNHLPLEIPSEFPSSDCPVWPV